ncbi:MAG TPA: DUF503 domain-containing protein [Bryobacterales bacterium]|jgi:uncharacterized protein YlxP (DUF503 family)|nr:DUF503 domain-containing protein [Bryobacterales bacterium]
MPGQPTIGVLTLDLHIEHSHSLKDKRQVLRSLRDRLRGRFNVATAEIDHQDSWQRAVIAVVTLSGDRLYVEHTLQLAEKEAANLLGASLVAAEIEYL